MLDSLRDLGLFVALVDAGSFSAAADALEVSKSAVSKHLARLEERLDARLLERTTRSMRLTDAGAAYYRRAKQIVDAAAEAEAEVCERQNTAVGRLVVSAPRSFAQAYLAPAVVRFVARHPRVQVTFDLTDRYVDLIEEGYDLAIRIGELADSSLVAKRISTSTYRLAASPAYLEANGRPRRPHDLERHACLVYRQVTRLDRWRFETKRGPVTVPVSGRLQSDDGDLLAQAAVEGTGVVYLPDFIVDPYVADGRLVSLLPRACRTSTPVWAVYPSRRSVSEKVRLFLEEVARATGR
ncbi:MAG: LysR family transcriptional regulator [Deltaproteobacteria bacterium]